MLHLKGLSATAAVALITGYLAVAGGATTASAQTQMTRQGSAQDPIHDCVTNPSGIFLGDWISCVVGQG